MIAQHNIHVTVLNNIHWFKIYKDAHQTLNVEVMQMVNQNATVNQVLKAMDMIVD